MATLHRRPDIDGSRLAIAPPLASWSKTTDPDQLRLSRYLEHVVETASPFTADDVPLALDLRRSADRPPVDRATRRGRFTTRVQSRTFRPGRSLPYPPDGRLRHRPPGREWTSLWKPTIDGLGPLVGSLPRPAKVLDDPRDGRITDLSVHSAEDLARYAQSMNGRPRRTLGYNTPAERLAELLAHTG